MSNMRRDGSMLSSALTGGKHRRNTELDFGIHRAMVVRVVYVDDEGNLTFDNRQVTYEVIILGGRKEGVIVPNVKAVSQHGGQFNYYEKIYRATEFQFSGPSKKPLSEHNGDIVYLQFINGYTSLPVIIGSGVSPLDKDSTGATKADGHILIDQYNGIKKSIDRDGNLKFERFGGEWQEEAGYFKPNEESESEMTMTAGEINLKNKSNNITLKDGDEPSITIKVTEKGDVTINNDGLTLNSLADVLINAAKAFKAIAKGDVEIEGANIKATSKGDVEVTGTGMGTFAGDGGTEVGSAAAVTKVEGSQVSLGGGGAPVSRIGDSAVGIGFAGVLVSSTIVSGSGITNSA